MVKDALRDMVKRTKNGLSPAKNGLDALRDMVKRTKYGQVLSFSVFDSFCIQLVGLIVIYFLGAHHTQEKKMDNLCGEVKKHICLLFIVFPHFNNKMLPFYMFQALQNIYNLMFFL